MELARNLSTRTSAPLPSSTASLDGLRIAAFPTATRVYPPLHLECGPVARVRAVFIPTLHGPQSRLVSLRCSRLPVPVHPRRPVCTQLYAALKAALVHDFALQLRNQEAIWLLNLRPFVARLVSRLIRKHGVSARCFTVAHPGYSRVRRSVWLQPEPFHFCTLLHPNCQNNHQSKFTQKLLFFTLIRSLCSGGLSNNVQYTPGDGGVTLASRCLHSTDFSSALSTAKLLAASIALQFIFWLFAQCTAAPASSSQTVVIMQSVLQTE